MAGAADNHRLLVMTVFFGPLPPWLPLTLHSMEANAGVDFVVVGDAAAPAVLPTNVRFEHVTYTQMQQRLARLTGKPVAYKDTYKANDIKPLLPALYPEAFGGYEWWGWADLDVVFGDLLKFLARAEPHPACCRGLEVACNKRARRDRSSPCFNSSRPMLAADTFYDRQACACTHGEHVTAVSPLYPNPWRKKCWGPFTLFKVSMGMRLFERANKWRDALSTWEYTHFDEWWGPFTQRGYDSMGDVMTRLSDEGELVMSRTLLPFAEAKSCVDIECTFCPCGATDVRLHGRTLVVNGEESMILHLAESKQGWARAARARAGRGGAEAASTAASPGGRGTADVGQPELWAMAPYDRAAAGRACFEVTGLGALRDAELLRHVGPTAVAALRYARHRPSSAKAAAALVYFKANGSASERQVPHLEIRRCDTPAGGANGGGGQKLARARDQGGMAAAGGGSASPTLETARLALRTLVARYDSFTSDERLRTLEWLCAWQRLTDLYTELLAGVDLSSPLSKRLPELHGNRRVRTPMYGGERLGWWRQTVNTSVDARGGACHPMHVPCAFRRWPEEGSRGHGRARRRHGRSLLASGEMPPALRLPGRALRAKRVARYDLNTPPVPGVACLPEEDAAASSALPQAQEKLFSGYLQLQHVQRAEYGRTQRWMCSWLYKLRACLDAERAQRVPPAASGRSRCRSIAPPNHVDAGLGWHGYDVTTIEDLGPLLFGLRCW